MVMPGATTRKPREKLLLLGWRTAFTVCHAMSMAMTVVLPAPVASLSARRISSGFAWAFAPSRCAANFAARAPSLGATSASQIAVSTASTWQKKGRTLLKSRSRRQCCNNRAVSGDTSHCSGLGRARHASTKPRTSLMIGVGLYSCSSEESPSPAPRTICVWPRSAARRFFGLGTGVIRSERRRPSTTRVVGCPSVSSSQWRRGGA